MDLDVYKAGQRQMWEGGDFRPIGRLLDPAARGLVAAAGIGPGQRVLDVATGSGSVAIAAARAGAEVTGVDITDAWFGEARARADAAGVTVALLVGDAEHLPVDDGAYDAVLSSFGVIFAPRHDLAAAELVRACRPGGTVALTAWIPGSSNDAVVAVLGRYLPSPPAFVEPAIRWGDDGYVRDLFARHGVDVVCHRPTLPVEHASPEAHEDFLLTNSGGFAAAREALRSLGRWDEAAAALRGAIAETNEADDGSYRVGWEYLQVIGTRRA